MKRGPNSVDDWFVENGVPHLMPNYSASEDIFTRMFRFLVLVTFAELFLTFTDDVDGWAQAGLFAIGFAAVLATLTVVNLLRGRRWNQVPDDVGPLELAVFVLVPPVLRTVVTGHGGDFWQWMITNLAILAVAYLVTSYGLFPMIPWALRQLRSQFVGMANLFAKSLPLLLLFSAFLFVNAEIWQVAYRIPMPFFIAVVGFIVTIGLLFVVIGLRPELDDLNTFSSWAEVDELCANSPLAKIGHSMGEPLPHPRPLARRERFNLGLLMVVSQSIQIALVALMVAVFYVVFGLFTVGQETILQWTTMTEFTSIFEFSLFGSPVVVTRPLLLVSGLIAAFSGLQFAVSLVTDETYRNEFSRDLRRDLRVLLAVRCRVSADAEEQADPEGSTDTDT